MSCSASGEAKFGEVMTFDLVGDASAMAIGHVNGDAFPDLLLTSFHDRSLNYLKGVGDGTFRGFDRVILGTSPENMTTADLDGDGDLDAIVSSGNFELVYVLLGDGEGGFSVDSTLFVPG